MPENILLKQRHVYSVSEITQDIKLILENTFGEVWVEGEVSGLSRIATGTTFFNLKDGQSLLKCVCFFSFNQQLKFEIKDGLKIICFGRISVYDKDGRYQLYVQKAEPKGLGSLQLALEQLKLKLEKEGLFAQAHKKPIPYLPARIGIVTSPTGAAIKDILKVLDRRFKDIHVIINSARVQGDGAKEEIARAIGDFNAFNQSVPAAERVGVLIVGRGGGSIEDLWAFNEEVVARAIYQSKIPVISAVGHERDWTLADLVADLRAPTPSAAAETVIPKKEDLQEKLNSLKLDLKAALNDLLLESRGDIDELTHRLQLLNPLALLNQYQEKILNFLRQIYVRSDHLLKLKGAQFKTQVEKLSSLNPLDILGRGYSIAFKLPDGQIIKDAKTVKTGDLLKTRLHQGEIISQVREVN